MKRVTFIKIFPIEIAWVAAVALVSAGLYHFSVGIDLSYDNYHEMITFEMRRNAMFFDIFTHYFLPLFFVACAIRLFSSRFTKIQTLLSLVVTALWWIAVLITTYIALGSENVVFSENGWTIYPPLSSIPEGVDTTSGLVAPSRHRILAGIVLLLAITIALTALTLRTRRKRS